MLNKLKIASWCIFDFASTIFMMNIVSIAFVQWIEQNYGKGDINYGIISAVVYGIALILFPYAGEICDRGWKLTPLFVLTTLSILGTFFIAFSTSLVLGAICFIVAYLTYLLGLTYYNALIDDITTPDNYGVISGLGVAARYSGSICGLVVIDYFIQGDKQILLPDFLKFLVLEPVAAKQTLYVNAFIPTAVLYCIFAIPLFFLIRPKKDKNRVTKTSNIVKSVINNLKQLFKNKNNFMLCSAVMIGGIPVYGAIHFMSVILKKIGGIPNQDIIPFLVIATLFSIAGGLGFGFSLRPVGSKKIFKMVLFIWIALFLAGSFAYGPIFMWVLGASAGIGMGGYWAIARILILDAAPDGKKGEYMSFFGIITVLCGIISSLLWPVGVWIGESWDGPKTFDMNDFNITFIKKVNKLDNPVSKYLINKMPSKLEKYAKKKKLDKFFKKKVINKLNIVIKKEALWSKINLGRLKLRENTKEYIKKTSEMIKKQEAKSSIIQENRVYTNRFLLEDVYPDEIAKSETFTHQRISTFILAIVVIISLIMSLNVKFARQ